MLNEVRNLFCHLERSASIRKRLLNGLFTFLTALWIGGFIYVLSLSLRYPGNAYIYVIVIAMSSEGIGSTVLVFKNVMKTWDQMYFDTALKYVRSKKTEGGNNLYETTNVRIALASYLIEINDPIIHYDRELAKKSLCNFCMSILGSSQKNEDDVRKSENKDNCLETIGNCVKSKFKLKRSINKK